MALAVPSIDGCAYRDGNGIARSQVGIFPLLHLLIFPSIQVPVQSLQVARIDQLATAQRYYYARPERESREFILSRGRLVLHVRLEEPELRLDVRRGLTRQFHFDGSLIRPES